MARKINKRTATSTPDQLSLDVTAIYLRVSTDRQVQDGYGLDAQRTQLLAYCQGQGWVVDESHIYVDAGISGKSTDRAGFQAMRQAAANGEISRIVALKIDRIARNLMDLLDLINQLTVQGVALVCVKESFDTGTANGRFMLQVLGAVGELERSMISERMDAGRQEKARQGGYNGSQCPLGYVYASGVFTVDSSAAQWITEVFTRFVAGQGMNAIAKDLNAAGAPTAKGGAWYAGTVRYVLQNGFYAGLTQWDGTEEKGSHPEIISRELYEAAHNRLQNMKRGPAV